MTKPNILFLFSDQHAQSVAGCYGDQTVQTPNIDRIAREGVRFNNAYCASPICVPSRMAALTARWPHRQECWTNDDMLRSDLPTWLHSAGASGYEPVLIGRMHAIGPDQMHGYAERIIGDHSPNWAGVPAHSMGVLDQTNSPSPQSLLHCGPGYSAYQAKDVDVCKAAVKWLNKEAVELDERGQPFCLTVGMMLPHPPYVVDQPAYELYAGAVPEPRLDRTAGSHEFHNWWREKRGINSVSAKQSAKARAAYWGLVHRMDEMIGTVIEALERNGLLDNTLIVYASDHGDHVGERELWWKHTFYEESVKVPLVMRLPGVLPQNETRDEVVNLIDLSQTLLESMSAEVLPNADGRSFWQLAKNKETPWVNETFSEYCTDPVPEWTSGRAVQQRMIRSGDWKLILYDSDPLQLFNLAEDPDELVNRAQDSSCSSKLKELHERLTDGWAPQQIAQRMHERRDEKNVLKKWAEQLQPKSTHVWDFSPDINRLEDF